MIIATNCILPIVIAGFWIWGILDVINHEPSSATTNDRIVWLLVALLLPGLGTFIYCIARRGERIRIQGH
jgi:uncharacterized membrane protein YczE